MTQANERSIMHLKDKVAIVTGGAHGMGEAEARLVGAEGAKVIVADILGSDAEIVAADIRAGGGEATAAKIDVTSVAEWVDLIAKALATYGRLDILVNNAGIPAVRSGTLTDWRAGIVSSPSTRPACSLAPSSRPSRWQSLVVGQSSTSARSWDLLAAPATILHITHLKAQCGSTPKPPRSDTAHPVFGSIPCTLAICRRC
jgi:hypothetical protein